MLAFRGGHLLVTSDEMRMSSLQTYSGQELNNVNQRPRLSCPRGWETLSINLQTQYSNSEQESQSLFLHTCYVVFACLRNEEAPKFYPRGFV